MASPPTACRRRPRRWPDRHGLPGRSAWPVRPGCTADFRSRKSSQKKGVARRVPGHPFHSTGSLREACFASRKAVARRARSYAYLERVAEGELDALDEAAVLVLLTERHGEVDDQRTDRRLPLQGKARGSTQVACVERP